MQRVHRSLQLPLVVGRSPIDGAQIVDPHPRVVQLHLRLLLTPLSGLKQAATLVKFSEQSVGSPVRQTSLFRNLIGERGFDYLIALLN